MARSTLWGGGGGSFSWRSASTRAQRLTATAAPLGCRRRYQPPDRTHQENSGGWANGDTWSSERPACHNRDAEPMLGVGTLWVAANLAVPGRGALALGCGRSTTT